jgi:phage/plasmid primase-like uncharacterized protein
MTLTLQSIAHALGGRISGREVLAPTPGHSKRDRGTAVRLAPGAPDGILVKCFNGGWHDEAQIKDTLRAAGILPQFDGTRRTLTEAERAAIKRAMVDREREREQAHAEAAAIARQKLAGAVPANPAHGYLVRKRIGPERLWQAGDSLLVPMVDTTGAVWSLQSIAPDGSKRFATGCRVKGLFWWAGYAVNKLVIGEGVATVAAVRRATGLPVIAAMTASNLPDIAAAIHAKRPDLTLLIAADDDPAGHEAARIASAQTGALIALPKECRHG